MKAGSFWKPFLISLMATPICLLFVFVLAGGGHGTYFPAKVLFPYTMLSALRFGTISFPFIPKQKWIAKMSEPPALAGGFSYITNLNLTNALTHPLTQVVLTA